MVGPAPPSRALGAPTQPSSRVRSPRLRGERGEVIRVAAAEREGRMVTGVRRWSPLIGGRRVYLVNRSQVAKRSMTTGTIASAGTPTVLAKAVR